MRDSCLRDRSLDGRIAVRLSPRLAALLLALEDSEEESAVQVTLPRARAQGLLASLGLPDTPGEAEGSARPPLASLRGALGEGLAAAEAASRRHLPARLTAREREVLQAISAGASYAEIARDLVIDLETVRSHAKRIRRKLGVSASSDLVGWTDTHIDLSGT
jgi:DNA-binding CsgD family transcriptional regulator